MLEKQIELKLLQIARNQVCTKRVDESRVQQNWCLLHS